MPAFSIVVESADRIVSVEARKLDRDELQLLHDVLEDLANGALMRMRIEPQDGALAILWDRPLARPSAIDVPVKRREPEPPADESNGAENESTAAEDESEAPPDESSPDDTPEWMAQASEAYQRSKAGESWEDIAKALDYTDPAAARATVRDFCRAHDIDPPAALAGLDEPDPDDQSKGAQVWRRREAGDSWSAIALAMGYARANGPSITLTLAMKKKGWRAPAEK